VNAIERPYLRLRILQAKANFLLVLLSMGECPMLPELHYPFRVFARVRRALLKIGDGRTYASPRLPAPRVLSVEIHRFHRGRAFDCGSSFLTACYSRCFDHQNGGD
jgi:hypothetical protein